MKEKKEVFESLRLDLQEFTPQEFVATCYIITCIGTSKGSYIDNNGDEYYDLTVEHSHLLPSKYKNESVPASGKVWTGKKGNSGKVSGTSTSIYYFVIDNTVHLAESYQTTSATS